MRPVLLLRAIGASLGAMALSASAAGAQSLTILDRTPAIAPRMPGSTVTLIYSAENHGTDSVRVLPSISLPDGWSVAMGSVPFQIGPHETEIWLVGVSIPDVAEAGNYQIEVAGRLRDGAGKLVAAPRTQVTVSRKRGLAVALLDHPLYAVEGDSYKLVFQLRNLGNGPATVRVAASSSLHNSLAFEPTVKLGAGEQRTFKVGVTTGDGAAGAVDEIVEIDATDTADDSITAQASSRVTIVQRAGTGNPFATIPATLSVRAGSPGADVAPYELAGGGRLDGSRSDHLEFLFRGPSGPNSILGEQRENRIELRGDRYRARAGDNYFALSPLTGEGQLGFGGGLDLQGELLAGGGYTQKFRNLAGARTESGAFLRFSPLGAGGGAQLSLNGVTRVGGPFEGRIFSSAVSLHSRGGLLLDAEYAGSVADAGRGSARSIRLSGGDAIHFDLSHVAGDAAFAGPMRNAENDFAMLSARASSRLQLNLTGNRSRYRTPLDSVVSQRLFSTATIGANYADRLSLEYSVVGATYPTHATVGTQRFLTVRVDHPLGMGRVWASLETGDKGDSAVSGNYHHISLGASASGRMGSASLFTELYDGGSLRRGASGLTTGGGSADLLLPGSNTISVQAYTSKLRTAEALNDTRLDLRLTHHLSSGASISLRMHMASGVTTYGSPTGRLGYLEYSLPLKLPVGRTQLPGRVRGRVVDAETGDGVKGALVRIGPLAAVTDADGQVTLAGLAPGEYRVSLANETSLANAVHTGSAVVTIDSLRNEAPSFRLAISQGSRLRGVVREFSIAKKSLSGEADSLAASGPIEGVTLALISAGDTLYRVTGADGIYDFDLVPSGHWTVVVQDAAPRGFSYERRRVDVVTTAGTDIGIDFRLLPKQRRVEIISGDGLSASAPTGPQRPHQ